MPPLHSFWRTSETLTGHAAPAREWHQLAGEDLPLAHHYLRPRADAVAELARPGDLPPLRVVRHGPDDVVGVCPLTGRATSLAQKDLVVFELDIPRLARAVAAALGFEAEPGVGPGPTGSARMLGWYRPAAGYSFPVYLALPLDNRELTSFVCEVVSCGRAPFVLVAPSRQRLRAAATSVLDRHASLFLALEEAVDVDASGGMTATPAAEVALGWFRDKHLPPPAGTPEFFPTPAGAAWPDLRVRFVDNHTVSASVFAVARRLNYTQMGMIDRRDAGPTLQWALLQAFSRGHGVLTRAQAPKGADKRRELLANDLRRFFRIEGDPITPLPGGRGWRTAFVLEPDG